MKGVDYWVFPYQTRDQFPPDFRLASLEGVLQRSFLSEGKRIVGSYFVLGSPEYPQHLEFVVQAHENISSEPMIGALVATTEKAGGVKFIYYDKVGVDPPYHNYGVAGKMFELAAKAGANRRISTAALRTTISASDGKYEGKSDIRICVNQFYIHGFGFVDKATGKELFPGARKKFGEIAGYIASLPPTAVPIDSSQLK